MDCGSDNNNNNNTKGSSLERACDSAARSHVSHPAHAACCEHPNPTQRLCSRRRLQRRRGKKQQQCETERKKETTCQASSSVRERRADSKKQTLTNWRFGADTAHFRSCMWSFFFFGEHSIKSPPLTPPKRNPLRKRRGAYLSGGKPLSLLQAAERFCSVVSVACLFFTYFRSMYKNM